MQKISEEIILQIKKLYDEGLSNLKIAKELGISNDTVSKYLRVRFGIVKKKFTKQIDYDKFVELWNLGKSDKEIAEFFKVKEITIKTYRTRGENAGKFNKIVNFSQEEHFLSELQDQFIRGSLLGDLNITSPNKNGHINSRLSLTHSKKQEDLFMSKVKLLENFMGSYRLQTPAPDKRTGKVYETWKGNSKSHKVFTTIYKELYIDGTKQLTQNYLNSIHHPIALAYWFMDDGTFRGTIATHCFSLKENKLLVKWMEDFWGINCTIQKELTNHKLYIKADSRYNFEKLIFPYIVSSMYYKLKYKDQLLAESAKNLVNSGKLL